jgi:hypothetical protein
MNYIGTANYRNKDEKLHCKHKTKQNKIKMVLINID